jgi:hypothetical protein
MSRIPAQPTGERLRRARRVARLSPVQAAGLLHCSAAQLSCWERRREPSSVVGALYELLMLKTGQFRVEAAQLGDPAPVDLRLADGDVVRLYLPIKTLEALSGFSRSASARDCLRCQRPYVGASCPGCRASM